MSIKELTEAATNSLMKSTVFSDFENRLRESERVLERDIRKRSVTKRLLDFTYDL